MAKVLLVNWDAYPNVTSGGVYSWEKILVESMPDYEFTIFNLLSNPNGNGSFTVPPQVKEVIDVPLFGSNRYEEFHDEKFRRLLAKVLYTKQRCIKQEFIPLFERFLEVIFSNDCDPKQLCNLIFDLHSFFIIYDYKKCLEHPLAWDVFIEKLDHDSLYQKMTLTEALTSFQLIQRNLQILSIQIPKVDLVHCSLAWLPSMIAVAAKMEQGCPTIITEHGVAFRELLLYYNAILQGEPANIFWKIFSRNVIRAVYSIADVIAPVCDVNAKWEERLGAQSSKIKVIYNGVNSDKFRPIEVPRTDKRPTVVCVGRVDAYKDLVNLIYCIKHVKNQVPDVQCLIYGGSADLDYSIRCVKAVKNLGLEDNVKFVGKVKDPELAYNAADVVVMTSITEGFPFTVIEAMACGKGIVATDVGGVREALEGCGLLVRSSHIEELSDAIIKLLQDEKLRSSLGALALKRARESFTIEQSISQYRQQYESLIARYHGKTIRKEVAAT
jgi:glycosyltransferase involved in cell wall biosynthesis